MRAPVSVIIPTLNAEADLGFCLAALGEGLAAGLIREVVVSDGGSTDATRAIAGAAGARLVTGPAGRGGQLRRGAEVAGGEWLLFLHADTWLAPGWATVVLEHIRGSRDAAWFRLAFRAEAAPPGIGDPATDRARFPAGRTPSLTLPLSGGGEVPHVQESAGVTVGETSLPLPGGGSGRGSARLHEAIRSAGWHVMPRLVAGWANLRSRAGLPYGDQGLLLPRVLYDSVGGYSDIALMEDVVLARRLRGRLRGLSAVAETSARRYRRGGWLRQGGSNLWRLARYLSGADPERLARGYGGDRPK